MEQHGLGDGAGMIFGMNMAQGLDEKAMKPSLSLDEQIEALTKLKISFRCWDTISGRCLIRKEKMKLLDLIK